MRLSFNMQFGICNYQFAILPVPRETLPIQPMHSNPLRLQTPRLQLVAATREMLQADLAGRKGLAKTLDATVPHTWPPMNWERGPIEFLLNWMQKRPDAQGWFAWYCLRRTGFQPVESTASNKIHGEETSRQVENLSYATLIGGIGFLGPPNSAGETIIGYSLLSEFHRRGHGPEAISALIDWAFSHPELKMLLIRTMPQHRPFDPRGRKARLRIRRPRPGTEYGRIRPLPCRLET